jgi:hypothetical protein
MTPSKASNSSIAEPEDTEKADMPEKEVKSLLFKMINDLKEDSNKQMKQGSQFKT